MASTSRARIRPRFKSISLKTFKLRADKIRMGAKHGKGSDAVYLLCSRCGVPLTSADLKAEACTQCGKRIQWITGKEKSTYS
jgi:DNA-directed RNA polymerase subunit RPC12/RpoP